MVCVHAAPFFGRGMFREIADSSLLALVGWGRGGMMIKNNCGVCVHATPFSGRGMFRELADSSLLALVGWGRGGLMIGNKCGVRACGALFLAGRCSTMPIKAQKSG